MPKRALPSGFATVAHVLVYASSAILILTFAYSMLQLILYGSTFPLAWGVLNLRSEQLPLWCVLGVAAGSLLCEWQPTADSSSTARRRTIVAMVGVAGWAIPTLIAYYINLAVN